MKRVYFARRKDGTGPIKIGCSGWPKARIAQLACDMKVPLEILAEAPGSFREEGRLHRQFAEYRLEGEWFEPSAEVLAALSHMQQRGTLPPVSEEDREIVMARRYLAGETLEAIAADFDITRERVRQILRASGIPSLGHRKIHQRPAAPATPEQLEIARLYSSGITRKELQARFPGISIASAIVKTGARSNRCEKALETSQQIAAAYESGERPSDIAARFGLSHVTHIYPYLKRAGASVRLRQKRARLKGQEDQIAAEYFSGATLDELSDRYQASREALVKALRAHDAARYAEEAERRRIEAVIAANKRRAHAPAQAKAA